MFPCFFLLKSCGHNFSTRIELEKVGGPEKVGRTSSQMTYDFENIFARYFDAGWYALDLMIRPHMNPYINDAEPMGEPPAQAH